MWDIWGGLPSISSPSFLFPLPLLPLSFPILYLKHRVYVMLKSQLAFIHSFPQLISAPSKVLAAQFGNFLSLFLFLLLLLLQFSHLAHCLMRRRGGSGLCQNNKLRRDKGMWEWMNKGMGRRNHNQAKWPNPSLAIWLLAKYPPKSPLSIETFPMAICILMANPIASPVKMAVHNVNVFPPNFWLGGSTKQRQQQQINCHGK